MTHSAEKLIKETFISLLEERPLSQITVKDICQSAGINRNSFYYHFEDLPSLISSIVMEESDRLIEVYEELDSLEGCLNVAVEFALSNRKLALHLYNSGNREIFEQYALKIIENVIRKYFEFLCRERDISARDKEIIISYYKCLMFGLLADWMMSGMNKDIRGDFRRLTEIYSGIPEEIVRRVTR